MSFLEELKRRNVFRVALAYGVVAWLALQVADVMIDNIGAPDWVFGTLLMVLAIGFPIALVMAWAFELTPDGIKREAEVDRSISATPQTGKRLDHMIIVVLGLAVGWLLFDKFLLESRESGDTAVVTSEGPAATTTSEVSSDATTPATSVAVLPFRLMSSGADDEYFADGLTEEILNALAQVPDLSVTSRTSAFFFKDKDLPIQEIAEQLGVEHVVEGSVRRSGDRLRVTAQLIRAGEDTHLWSETYDSTSDDAIAVQEDIALEIAETLGVFLDGDTLARMQSAGLRDVTAFIAYQKGRELHSRAHGDENMMALLIEGNAQLKTALDIQPNFPLAWLFYSDYYTHLLIDDVTGEKGRSLTAAETEQAYDAARKAFINAARSSKSPTDRAFSELDLAILEGNSAAWRTLFEDVLEETACAEVIWHQLLGFLPEYAPRFADLVQRLRACDPMINRYNEMFLSANLWGGQPEQAMMATRAHTREESEFFIGWKIKALVSLGAFDEAMNIANIDVAEQRDRLQMLNLIAAAQSDYDTARRHDAAIRSAGDDNRFLGLMRAAWMGDRERANELAAEMDAAKVGHMVLMMTTYWCACGSPFDLEATPNFARIWGEASLPWPLESPIDFPLKDW